MSEVQKTPAELLATPVQFLKGVGPQRCELLAKLGAERAIDLLYLFPRDYLDVDSTTKVGDLSDGAVAQIQGAVVEVDYRQSAAGRGVLGVLVRCQGGHVRLLWFNQPFMKDKFAVGQQVFISGKVRWHGLVWEFTHPQVKWLDVDEAAPVEAVLPVYSLTEGLAQRSLRTIVRQTIESHAPLVEDVLPAEYLAAHKLAPIQQAIRGIHAPRDREELAVARRRFIYQEFLVLQLGLAYRRRQRAQVQQAPPLPVSAKIDARIRRLFPFEFTAAQNQAIAEMTADLARPHPMHRLLQGDVGSGKTVVALYALLLAAAHRQQAVLMAPTEVLARQHAEALSRALAASQVKWAVLTGGMPAGERAAVLSQAAAGELDLVIGTQAVIQEDVEFARLGLTVIDEQHKFGVAQRASLKQAGLDPHYLVMTATPIPRTITLTSFGDLDVSTLREAPPGRPVVHTYLANAEQRDAWWEFFRKKLLEGRQGFVVTPLLQDSEAVAVQSVEAAYEALANGPLEAFRLGLLHGRLAAREKDAIMADFRAGKLQVVVATTVVEVGIDVPNATLMAIEGGERFGLSQLHQLRGRVSRGTFPGYCCVFADNASPEARQRLEAFAATTDGFRLAEMDLALRGPGDMLGVKQHGLPPLRIADVVRDADVLEEARRDADALLASDPEFKSPQYERLRRMMFSRYGRVLELGEVG